MLDHDKLIDRLSAGANPVKRISAPGARMVFLVTIMLALGFIAATMFRQAAGGWTLPTNGTGIANAALCLVLGAAALFQAFAMSIPGREVRGVGAMMIGLAAWLTVASTSIGGSSVEPLGPGDRPFCFAFLLVTGLPMVAVVILSLRRTRSLKPVQSLVAAGAGVAFLALSLLAFCHPAEVSIVDFATHVMAALVLGLLTVAIGHKLIAP